MSPLTVLAYAILIFFLRFGQWYLFLGRRLGEKHLAYVDTWWFLSETRKLKKGNFKLASKYREDRIESDNHYPPLFLYLLAIIPDRYVDYAIRYGSPLLDALLASTLFSSVVLMTNSIELGLVGTLVYFSSPMIFQQNFCLCVRPLTIFFVSIIYLLSCNFSIPSFLGLSILISIILLLHKFATQVVIFTSLAFLIIGRFDYLLSVVAGFLISMLISKGYYLKVLKAHINRLRSSDLKQFADSRARNPLKRTLVLAVYCPWLIFFAISVFILDPNLFSIVSACTFTWIMALIVPSIITNFWIMRVIGEGWRYLGYLVFPLAFYAAAVIDHSPILLWTYILFAFSGLVIGYYYTRRLYQTHQKYLIDHEDIEIFKKMSSIEGNRIIAYPNEFTYVVSYFSEKDYATVPETADITVVNKELVEESLHKTLEERGYLVKFEEKEWIVYVR